VYGGLNLRLHLPIVRIMQNNPRLTDTNALRRNRARADLTNGMFLHAAAIAEVQDRLSLVNRQFTAPAIVTGFPAVWSACLPKAMLIPDEEVLELQPQKHDLVVHGLGLHWADDPVGQIIQCRRALKDDGFCLFVTFGGRTLYELRASLAQAEVEITGGLSPRVAPMGEIRDLGALLQRAGLALPVADTVPLKVTYESPWALMKDLRAMGEGNALNDRIQRPTRRSILTRASEIYVKSFMKDGRIPATFEMIFLTGWAPDASQPKPLRPGSATNRLADALSTSEFKLPK
jgi:SAM-dependent methyltransferase